MPQTKSAQHEPQPHEVDPAVIEALLLDQYDRLHRYVVYRLNRHLNGLVSPEDLVQDICLLAIRHRKSFVDRGNESFQRWLITIARNHLLEVIRTHAALKRDRGRELRVASQSHGTTTGGPTLNLVASQSSPSSAVARDEARSLLADSISTLKPDYRRALELRYLRGMNLAQTASEMNRSTVAVQMLCHRALIELRGVMGNRSRFF